jgi:hypothetical protein
MPLGRYFVFAGGILLALLYLADWYLPKGVQQAARADVDRSIIRIHSKHKWPEAVVIDTTLPTIVPPLTTAAANVPTNPNSGSAIAQLPPAGAAMVAAARQRKAHPQIARSPVRNRVATYQANDFRSLSPSGW